MNGPTELIESGLRGDILLSKTLPAAAAAARRLKANASWEINREGEFIFLRRNALIGLAWYTLIDANDLASSLSQPISISR